MGEKIICDSCKKEFGNESIQIDLICLGAYNKCATCLNQSKRVV